MAATSQRLVFHDACVATPDNETRMRLKQAMIAITEFRDIQLFGALDRVLERLSGPERCDVIFVSGRYDLKDIEDFVKSAKETKRGRDAAYILVLGSGDQTSSGMASHVMVGADGLLFEPFSVDALQEITELAARVRKERRLVREKLALKFLVEDVIQYIDFVAVAKTYEVEHARSLRKLREVCEVFRTLSDEAMASYFELIVERFCNATLPDATERLNSYHGASVRVKGMVTKRVLDELSDNLEAQSEGHLEQLKGND